MFDLVAGQRGSLITHYYSLIALPSDGSVPGFGVEQAPYGMQTQNYSKGSLLDVCPASSAPSVLSSEPDFQMLSKSRLNTVSVNYCPVSQDFAGSNLNLLTNGPGKIGASEYSSQ